LQQRPLSGVLLNPLCKGTTASEDALGTHALTPRDKIRGDAVLAAERKFTPNRRIRCHPLTNLTVNFL
jgi:hypothetical protein